MTDGKEWRPYYHITDEIDRSKPVGLMLDMLDVR